MYRIFVHTRSAFPSARYEVIVENDLKTIHMVDLKESYYQSVCGGKIAPEDLIKKSFEFLLAREPNTSILQSFSLNEISSYFSEYESEIKRMVMKS